MRVRVSPTAPYKCNLTSFDLYIRDYTVLRMRILFIGPTRVGDTILATSIINHYINKYKSSEFTVVTSSVSQNLFKKMPQLQNLITINKMRFSLHWLKIWSKVFIYRWDLVIDLRSSVLSYLVITKERKIFKGNNYDHKVVQFTKFLDTKEKIIPEIWFDKNDVDDAKKILPVEGPYIAIGHDPATALFKEQLDMDKEGYLLTKPDSTETNIPGVYAAGDVKDKTFRQAVTAAGMGCMAALEAEKHLSHK